nr:PREDICTED: peroxisomal leader peptide-processing protease [Lepisosteus oculatus]
MSDMRAVEDWGCTVSVFEISEESLHINITSNGKVSNPSVSEGPQRGLAEPLSCSGTLLDSRSGIVLCHSLVFSAFLNKSINISDYRVLFPDSFSSRLHVYVQRPEELKSVDNTKQQSHVMRQCLGKAKQTVSKPSPQKAELLMLVSNPQFQKAFTRLFNKPDEWRFCSNTGDIDLDDLKKDTEFLSWFAVLKVPGLLGRGQRALPWVSSSSLKKGDVVFACGSPFGSFCPDLFMNTLSKGIVSNVAGESRALILTDARCLPGTEGGGLFLDKGGRFCLAGLIVSPLCWRAGEWIGLTLVCSLESVVRNIWFVNKGDPCLNWILSDTPSHFVQDLPVTGEAKSVRQHPTVALVQSGELWGSGVLMNSRMMLTCRHVVNGASRVVVKINNKERLLTAVGNVVYSTKDSSPYDVAVVLLAEPLPSTTVPAVARDFRAGEDVYVTGYGVFGQSCGPSVTSGILSRIIACDFQPAMLQTTCAVQAGASGGAVIRAATGELLGLVSSNTRDCAAGVTYSHLNFSVPVTVLSPLLRQYALTGDSGVFEELDRASDAVRAAWRLQGSHGLIPRSKL